MEETEAAKKLLQEKRLMGRAKTKSTIPSSYSADYFQRGKDYAEKLRRVLMNDSQIILNFTRTKVRIITGAAAVDGGGGGDVVAVLVAVVVES
ncbi:hypothetical protein E3N88_13740 [Mikania micrantha]|uniref:Uncharacterized protein n=1 Tax=Mikania micrantha TaxID=192012 RepID=A0A5N6NZC2_9ASTR|nr:hypothetical protein E3N88_13740 [Mikania micrantha]